MSNKHHFEKSSSMASCDYDDDKKIMKICFNSGVYHFFDVPRKVYEALKEAKSPGSHFHTHIRNKYQGVKQDE